jgi:hypothetical protein
MNQQKVILTMNEIRESNINVKELELTYSYQVLIFLLNLKLKTIQIIMQLCISNNGINDFDYVRLFIL